MTFSDLVNIAQIIAMLAALAAVWYAEGAVRETRALRREDRVARLLDVVAEYADVAMRAGRGQVSAHLVDAYRARIRAAISVAGEPLVACATLVALQWPRHGVDEAADQMEADCVAAVGRALDEIAAWLVRLRAEGASLTDNEP